jgi:hypothetical protein
MKARNVFLFLRTVGMMHSDGLTHRLLLFAVSFFPSCFFCYLFFEIYPVYILCTD